MRRFVALLLVAFLPTWASESVVQSTNPAASACGTSSGTNCTFSPSSTGAGHTLVAWLWYSNGNTITAPSGWTTDSSSLASGTAYSTEFFYYVNAPSTNSVVFTTSGANSISCGWFYEISSSSGAGWPKFDTSAGAFTITGSMTSNTGPSLTLNGNDDVIIQGARIGPNGISSAGAGYTLEQCSQSTQAATAYQTNASTDGAMSWTPVSADTNWILNVEAFCDNGSGRCTPGGFPQILEFFDRSIRGYLAILTPGSAFMTRSAVKA
jgi:hypothetical protein